MAKPATVVLTKDKTCKSCVRFVGKDADSKDVTASLYLQNVSYEALGKPNKIKVSVEAAK